MLPFTFAGNSKNMKETERKKGKTVGQQNREFCAKLIAEGKQYLPAQYVEEVFEELCKSETVPEEKVKATKQAIQDATKGKNHRLSIAKAIFNVGMKYKNEMQELEKQLPSQA
jgi:hypothetical protein